MPKKAVAPRTKVRPKNRRPPAKKAARARTPRDEARLLREYEEARAPEIDRYIQRWARRLLLVIGGKVRRLTEEEVRAMAKPTRHKATRKRTARKTPTKSR